MGKPTVRRNTVIYRINLFSTDYLGYYERRLKRREESEVAPILPGPKTGTVSCSNFRDSRALSRRREGGEGWFGGSIIIILPITRQSIGGREVSEGFRFAQAKKIDCAVPRPFCRDDT